MARLFNILLISILLVGCKHGSEEIKPSSSMKITLSSNEVKVGETFNYSISGANDISSIVWNFGNDETSSKISGTYSYSNVGSFVITASVKSVSLGKKELKATTKSYYQEVADSERTNISNSFGDDAKVQICAHRGYWKVSPENSILSITKAINAGIDMVELDIRTTKDGQLILLHDEDLSRTSNGQGKVQDYSYAELQNLFLYNGSNLTTETIPLFSDALKAARGKIYIDIDVKKANYTTVYNLVKQYGMVSQVLFTSKDINVIKLLQGLDSNVNILPIVYDKDDLEYYISQIPNLVIVQYNTSAFTDEIVEFGYENGVKVFKNIYINTSTTPTSDSYKQVDEFLRLNGNVIQTDFPVELKEYIKI